MAPKCISKPRKLIGTPNLTKPVEDFKPREHSIIGKGGEHNPSNQVIVATVHRVFNTPAWQNANKEEKLLLLTNF